MRKTVGVIYDEWFNTAKYSIKESTASNYQMKADKHILPYFGDKAVSSVAKETIYSFIDEKRKNNLSDRYISDILVLLKTIFKFAVQMNLQIFQA